MLWSLCMLQSEQSQTTTKKEKKNPGISAEVGTETLHTNHLWRGSLLHWAITSCFNISSSQRTGEAHQRFSPRVCLTDPYCVRERSGKSMHVWMNTSETIMCSKIIYCSSISDRFNNLICLYYNTLHLPKALIQVMERKKNMFFLCS